MSQASDYLEQQLMYHTFGGTAFTKPSTLGISLHTANPTDADTGAEAVSTAGNYENYERVGATPGPDAWTFWQGGTTGSISNKLALTFPAGTGTDNTALTHFGVYDATVLGTGNLICYGALNSTLTVTPGVTPEFAVAALVVTLA